MLHATIHAAGDANGTPLPLSVTFEEVAAALKALPRLYFEPDGSFVWVSDDPLHPWQLDGQLQDQGDRLDHVVIKGTCSPEAFRQLLDILRGEASQLTFQLVGSADFADETAAIRLLSVP